MMLGLTVPVDQLAEAGTVTTVETDPSALFYLVAALLAASLALVFVHPGRRRREACRALRDLIVRTSADAMEPAGAG